MQQRKEPKAQQHTYQLVPLVKKACKLHDTNEGDIIVRETSRRPPPEIFLSYSRANVEFVQKIRDELENLQYSTWMDQSEIDGGSEWEAEIEKALVESKIFIVTVSKASNGSNWVRRESIRAEQLNKIRIPLLLDNSVELPLRLLDLQYVDFRGSYEVGFAELLQVLEKALLLGRDDNDASTTNEPKTETIQPPQSSPLLLHPQPLPINATVISAPIGELSWTGTCRKILFLLPVALVLIIVLILIIHGEDETSSNIPIITTLEEDRDTEITIPSIAATSSSWIDGAAGSATRGGKSSWRKVGNDIFGDVDGGRLGYSLAMSLDGLILCAAYLEPSHQSNDPTNAFVRSYHRSFPNATQWKEFHGFDIEAGTSPYTFDGPDIALSGDGMVLAVGGRPGSAVATYLRRTTTSSTVDSSYSWEFLGETDGTQDANTNALASVTLNQDGTVLAVAGTEFRKRGLVRIYQRSIDQPSSSSSSNVVWTSLIDIDGYVANEKGALSLYGQGRTIAIGSEVLRTDDGTLIDTTGEVRVFERSVNRWSLKLTVDGIATDEFLGKSVALSSDGLTLVIGAASNPPAEGSVLVYKRDCNEKEESCISSSWTKLGESVLGQRSGSRFGHSLSITSDGTIFASGAIYGGSGGQVSAFLQTDVVYPARVPWEQLGDTIEAEAQYDDFGTDVALSGDGTVLVASAPCSNAVCDDDGFCNTVNVGQIRTYFLV